MHLTAFRLSLPPTSINVDSFQSTFNRRKQVSKGDSFSQMAWPIGTETFKQTPVLDRYPFAMTAVSSQDEGNWRTVNKVEQANCFCSGYRHASQHPIQNVWPSEVHGITTNTRKLAGPFCRLLPSETGRELVLPALKVEGKFRNRVTRDKE